MKGTKARPIKTLSQNGNIRTISGLQNHIKKIGGC